jgi:hypothetical protein
MRNIFLLYMPPTNQEAMAHYEDTIRRRVPFDRISSLVTRNEAAILKDVFGDRPLAVWGSRDTPRNRALFEKMTPGDHLLIVEGASIKFVGKVALKTVNPALSRELWDNIIPGTTEGWDLIYFIANPIEIDVPFRDFGRFFGYEDTLQLRGFTTVNADRLAAFYEHYDDPYSVLLKLASRQPVVEKEAPIAATPPPPLVEVEPEDVAAVLQSPVVSEHVKMQWKLASLGLKAGEKVWVPAADQSRLRTLYNFNEFEPEFSAGIDLPKNYFENIDVVWKEQFRINAAFEVENTTAIYSGLLRFADLNIVAPNTIYPMFIVAPAERRNRVREQLMRPVFGRLDLRSKVRFLPYETINEIDQFFSSATSGLSVDLMRGRSESLV